MATQVFRVTRVLTAAASPVARLQAVDQSGHEMRLEVPVALVQQVAAGHVLVVNWSVHALPELAPAAPDVPQIAAEVSAPSGRAVDDAFMELMSRVGRDTPIDSTPLTSTTPASATRREAEIRNEFNTLLGAARRKG